MTTRDEILRRDFSEENISCIENMPNINFFGYRLVGTELITKRVQARTHKNKRINKKWLKRYGYRQAPASDIYIFEYKFEKCIIAHPKTIEKLIKEYKKRVNT